MTHPERPIIMNKIDELLARLDAVSAVKIVDGPGLCGEAAATIRALRGEVADLQYMLAMEVDEAKRLREALAVTREKLIPAGNAWTGQEPHWQRDAYLTSHAALDASHGRVG